MRTLFTKNVGWKLLSISLAVLLWYVIVRDPDLATSVNVPVLFKGMPPDMEISSDLPERVHLEVRATGPTRSPGPTSRCPTAWSSRAPFPRRFACTSSNGSAGTSRFACASRNLRPKDMRWWGRR